MRSASCRVAKPASPASTVTGVAAASISLSGVVRNSSSSPLPGPNWAGIHQAVKSSAKANSVSSDVMAKSSIARWRGRT